MLEGKGGRVKREGELEENVEGERDEEEREFARGGRGRELRGKGRALERRGADS